METLTITRPLFEELFHHDEEVETISYGFLGVTESSSGREFHIREVWKPPPEGYAIQTSYRVRTTKQTTSRVLEKLEGHAGLLVLHTHMGQAFWSPLDQQDGSSQEVLLEFVPFYLRAVVGENGFHLEVKDSPQRTFRPLDRVKIIGQRGIQFLTPLGAPPPPKAQKPRLDTAALEKTLMISPWMEKALQRIGELHWGIIGAGGGASAFLDIFKFLRPRLVSICDADFLEETNMNRFFGYREGDLGKDKVEVLKRELEAFNPYITVYTKDEDFPSPGTEELLKSADVIICFPDNNWTRDQAAQFAARHQKVLFEGGTGIYVNHLDQLNRVSSHIRVQLPAPPGPCLRCLGLPQASAPIYEEIRRQAQRSYVHGRPDMLTPASVVTVNSVAASLMVRQILGYFCPDYGDHLPAYLLYDELLPGIQDLTSLFQREPQCPICGEGRESLRAYGDRLPGSMTILSPPEKKEEFVAGRNFDD